MATGNCRHCGHSPVADSAKACPNCGGNDPRSSPFASFIIGLIVLGGALIVIILTLASK